jgi:hypothetical protein
VLLLLLFALVPLLVPLVVVLLVALLDVLLVVLVVVFVFVLFDPGLPGTLVPFVFVVLVTTTIDLIHSTKNIDKS